MQFPTTYKEILDRIDQIDPVKYSKTRNFLDGAVTYLSPYISRGVISTQQVLEAIVQKGYTLQQSEKLIQELAWRDYYQRTWQHLEDDMFEDIRQRYTGVKHRNLPAAILNGNTGIEAIDKAIHELYETGYIHNHLRMYIASITCNIGKADWLMPSQWMYYHLLDGDLASNTCSWQWVAGHFSAQQYYCNQENINKYTGSNQQHSFLDKGYETLPTMEVPATLIDSTAVHLTTTLPAQELPVTDPSLPLLIFTPYNLDPMWHAEMKANRILLLEPSHFKKFPVSKKVMDFILELSKNIDGIQLFSGEANEIPALKQYPVIYSKEHPSYKHLPGIKEERDWMFPDVKGFFNSFFGFWKKCEQQLRAKEKDILNERRA
jgi:deoxyribodipyrimidine photo-lyase